MPNVLEVKSTIVALESIGRGPTIITPTNIIPTNKDSLIKVEWQVSGPLATTFRGFFHLMFYLESLGPDPTLELTKDALTVPARPGPGPASYQQEFKIAADTVPAGTYMLNVTITFFSEGGEAMPIAGFAEGPILQFYDERIAPPTSWPEPGSTEE